jgi:hypothetical protein
MDQNDNLSGAELIGKLENISGLYAKTLEIQQQMEDFVPEDHYERKVEVPQFPGEYDTEKQRQLWREKLDHTYEGILELAERTHREVYGPKEPEKPQKKAFVNPEDTAFTQKRDKFNRYSLIALGVSIFFLLGAIFGVDESTSDTLPTIYIIVALGAALFGFLKYKVKTMDDAASVKRAEALAAHDRQHEERMEEYAKQMESYESEKAQYEVKLQKFMEDYRAWREIYLQSLAEEAKIAKNLEADRKAAVEKIYQEHYLPAEAALNEANDLVAENYLPVLKMLIDLLKSKRADDLKEAINLYEDIVYRERQLALEREKEAQRRREEEQRRRDEERRYQEDKRFREDQEQQRRHEEERRQQDAERRHKEEMEQRDRMERDRQTQERRQREEDRRRQERAESDRRQREDRDTRDQCNRCASVGHCSMAFRRPNCASFRPR